MCNTELCSDKKQWIDTYITIDNEATSSSNRYHKPSVYELAFSIEGCLWLFVLVNYLTGF